MNITQIKKLIDKELSNDEQTDYSFYEDVIGCPTDKEVKLKGGVNIKFIAQTGECNDGATLITIIEIENKYYALPWIYSSWESGEIYSNDIYEVEQKEVTRTEWVKKSK